MISSVWYPLRTSNPMLFLVVRSFPRAKAGRSWGWSAWFVPTFQKYGHGRRETRGAAEAEARRFEVNLARGASIRDADARRKRKR